jgi:hypothetical protein
MKWLRSTAKLGLVCWALSIFLARESEAWWSDWITGGGWPQTCGFDHLLTELWCSQAYCGLIALNFEWHPERSHRERRWLRWVSEEAWHQHASCEPNELVTGMLCYGAHCDNKSLECTVITPGVTQNCQWSPWFSEEQGTVPRPEGAYIHAVQCLGAYCDQISLEYCQLS